MLSRNERTSSTKAVKKLVEKTKTKGKAFGAVAGRIVLQKTLTIRLTLINLKSRMQKSKRRIIHWLNRFLTR